MRLRTDRGEGGPREAAPLGQHRLDGTSAARKVTISAPRALKIKAGADLNKANNKGFFVLMYACQNGHGQCARVLVDAGEDL